MGTVRRASDVHARLHQLYGHNLARSLYALWVSFSSLGEEKVRATMPRATYFRHRKQLVSAGVAWANTIVEVDAGPTIIPSDFTPARLDRRRVVSFDPRVAECVERFAA